MHVYILVTFGLDAFVIPAVAALGISLKAGGTAERQLFCVCLCGTSHHEQDAKFKSKAMFST